MLPKANRAGRKTADAVFKTGRSINSAALNLKFLNLPGEKKISIIVPKSVAKSAVKRNTLRRRGYQALQKIFNKFPKGINAVLILKSRLSTTEELEQEIQIILNKLR